MTKICQPIYRVVKAAVTPIGGVYSWPLCYIFHALDASSSRPHMDKGGTIRIRIDNDSQYHLVLLM